MVETANSAGSRTPEVVLVVGIVLSGVCRCLTTYMLNNYNIANFPAISYVVAVAHDNVLSTGVLGIVTVLVRMAVTVRS